jgi:hypothetical protein
LLWMNQCSRFEHRIWNRSTCGTRNFAGKTDWNPVRAAANP